MNYNTVRDLLPFLAIIVLAGEGLFVTGAILVFLPDRQRLGMTFGLAASAIGALMLVALLILSPGSVFALLFVAVVAWPLTILSLLPPIAFAICAAISVYLPQSQRRVVRNQMMTADEYYASNPLR